MSRSRWVSGAQQAIAYKSSRSSASLSGREPAAKSRM